MVRWKLRRKLFLFSFLLSNNSSNCNSLGCGGLFLYWTSPTTLITPMIYYKWKKESHTSSSANISPIYCYCCYRYRLKFPSWSRIYVYPVAEPPVSTSVPINKGITSSLLLRHTDHHPNIPSSSSSLTSSRYNLLIVTVLSTRTEPVIIYFASTGRLWMSLSLPIQINYSTCHRSIEFRVLY